jgi:integrase
LDKWLLPALGDLPLSAVDNDPIKELVAKMVASEELGPKSTNEYIKLVKMIVASAKDPKTRKQLHPVFWDSEYLDLPIVEKRRQKRPAFDGETVTGLVGSAKRYVQMVYILAASLGMRIGEVLALEIDKHFADDFSTVLVRQKVRKCKLENYLKTPNSDRDIDLHSSVVKMLKEFIGLRTSGFCSPLGMESRSRTPTSLTATCIQPYTSWVGATQEQGTKVLETMPSADSAIRFCERIMSQTI